MKKILVAAFLCASSLVASFSAQAADELRLYNWNNYLAPETALRFEAFCKCKLVQTYYGDNEEMLAKLAAGAKGYDIIVPTGNALDALIKQKALQPLDKTQLPHFKNVNPVYVNTAGQTHQIPTALNPRT